MQSTVECRVVEYKTLNHLSKQVEVQSKQGFKLLNYLVLN